MPVITQRAPIAPDKLVRVNLQNDGYSDNMAVDGSSPKEFTYCPSGLVEIFELRLIITTDSIRMNGASFFEESTLSNGCDLDISSLGTTSEMACFTRTEDFFMLPGLADGNIFVSFGGEQDVVIASFPLPYIMLDSTCSDFVKMTINDDLTDHIKYLFSCTVLGRKA